MPAVADDLADIRAYNQSRGPQCRAGLMFAAMDPELRRTVESAIADPTIEMKSIVRWLADKRGITIGYDSLSRHAKRECRCG